MKHYKHQQASSAKEAASSAASGTAALIAGGTDLLGTLKDEILPTYPDTVIDLKTIPDMDAIVEDGDAVRIGALAKLSDVADSDAVKSGCAALAEACARAASPTTWRRTRGLTFRWITSTRIWRRRARRVRRRCRTR